MGMTISSSAVGLEIRHLLAMIAQYGERQLTYDEDAMNAIRGIISRFEARGIGQCHYGHPRNAFVPSLCWETQRSRRDKARQAGFPSWSWLGWQGAPTWVGIKRGFAFTRSANQANLMAAPPCLCITARITFLDECLGIRSECATLRFSAETGDNRCLLIGQKERPLTEGPFRNVYFYSKENPQPAAFWLTQQDLRACQKPDIGVYEAEFLLLLSIRLEYIMDFAENDSRVIHETMIWALMLARQDDGTVRRGAVVQIPSEIWEGAAPQEQEILLA